VSASRSRRASARLVTTVIGPGRRCAARFFLIVEIGADERVSIGDVATFFDAQDGSRPEDLAASCNSSVYDLTMHLHAGLPRRVVRA
jgi:alanine racemase